MEKVFFVENEDLEEVNEALAKGGKVKMISTVSESAAVGGQSAYSLSGDVLAYIVVEMPIC